MSNKNIDGDPFANAMRISEHGDLSELEFPPGSLFGDETNQVEASSRGAEAQEHLATIEEFTKITPFIHKKAQSLVERLDDSFGFVVAKKVNAEIYPGEYSAATQNEWSVLAGNVERILKGGENGSIQAVMQIRSRIGSVKKTIGRAKQSSHQAMQRIDEGHAANTDKALWDSVVATSLAGCIETLNPEFAIKLLSTTNEEYLLDAIVSIYESSSNQLGRHVKSKFEKQLKAILDQ